MEMYRSRTDALAATWWSLVFEMWFGCKFARRGTMPASRTSLTQTLVNISAIVRFKPDIRKCCHFQFKVFKFAMQNNYYKTGFGKIIAVVVCIRSNGWL